jgi:hypothetical protein
MSDITVINDSEQSSLVTNGLAKNGELYLKADGSTDAGAIVVYDSGSWRTFANEASAGFSNTYSVDFDGTNDYLDTGTNFQSTFRSDFTISTWFKDEAASGTKAYFGLRSNTSPKNDVICYTNGSSIFVWMYYNNTRSLTNFSHTRDSDWHHLVYRVNQNGSDIELRAYLDGVYKIFTSQTNSMSSWTNTGTFAIGARNFDTSSPDIYFEGKQDEFAIFGSALSDGSVSTGQTAGGDIATLYNSGVPADISSLSPVAWYRMGDNDSGSGTTITDQGSGSNDGTLTNGPTFSTDVPS